MAEFLAAWWWIDRWRKSTAYTDMTLAEQGAYRNLIDELWLRGGAIPKEDRILAQVSGAGMDWPSVKDAVLARFYETDEGFRNETHDEVQAKAHDLREDRKAAGKARAAQAQRGPDGRFLPSTLDQHTDQQAGEKDQRAIQSPSPSPNSGTVSDSGEEVSVSSSASPQKKPPSSSRRRELDREFFFDAWARLKRDQPRVDVVSRSRETRAHTFCKMARKVDKERWQHLVNFAITAFASDPKMREGRWGVDTLLRDDKMAKWLDAGLALLNGERQPGGEVVVSSEDTDHPAYVAQRLREEQR